MSRPSDGESERRRLRRFGEAEEPAARLDAGAVMATLDGTLNGDEDVDGPP